MSRDNNVGVLLLHGFTGSLRTVNGLVPLLDEAGIDHEMPVLRGHGTHYRDLVGVTARDWYIDGERALLSLAKRVERVVVVGLSMGGLVALELGMRQADKVAGLVTLAPAITFVDPLTVLSPVLAKLFRFWPAPAAFNDKSLSHTNDNYAKFATDAFVSLYRYGHWVRRHLRDVRVPIRILMSKKDQVVAPKVGRLVYDNVASPDKELISYEKSGHEMMQDLEREKVFADVMAFVSRFVDQAAVPA